MLFEYVLAQQVQPADEPAGPAGIGWRPGRGLVQNGFDMPVLGRERRDVLGEISLQGGEQPVLLDLGVRTQHGGDPAAELRQARNVRGGTGGPRLADQAADKVVFPGQLVDSGLAAAVLAHVILRQIGLPGRYPSGHRESHG